MTRNVEMPTSKGKSILIVDDDEDLTNLYETFLKYDGYRVDAFTDPIDALYSFRKNVYDLVLLDLKMLDVIICIYLLLLIFYFY